MCVLYSNSSMLFKNFCNEFQDSLVRLYWIQKLPPDAGLFTTQKLTNRIRQTGFGHVPHNTQHPSHCQTIIMRPLNYSPSLSRGYIHKPKSYPSTGSGNNFLAVIQRSHDLRFSMAASNFKIISSVGNPWVS